MVLALLSPMLPNYRPSTPPLAEHLLMPQQRAHCCLGEIPTPTFCRRKGHPDDASTATVDWASVRRACKEWLKNPMNIALLLWLLCVGVSGGMFVLLLLGLLDGAFPAAAERNRWIEINVQVLNALFTLMSLYQHPALCHHLFLLCRWRPRDAADLRAAYCKGAGAAPRPRDRVHMAVVVALLHLTVACQYVQCGLYWGYSKATRPELAEAGFFVLGVVAPVAAAVYTVCSPLGKDGQCHELAFFDSTSATQMHPTPVGHLVIEPEWAGGMFDCGGDAPSTWCLSLSCTFCVFGWNMERLGFGNAYVHAVTFALLCFAPLWVLGVSALHIHDYVICDVVGGAGVLLCACGLLYGGYWRIQMRKRFGLPGSRACCGSKSLTDYARWLLCWPWALAQEVRTANLYHVDGEILYSKVAEDDHADSRKPLLVVSNDHDVFRATDTVIVSQASPPNGHLVVVDDETTMAPPVQVVVVQQLEGDKSDDSSVPLQVTEEDGHGMPSDGSWRVEKVKKLINMVTLVSLLILLYTRGIIL
ncbi:hypothetical protein SETIT_8G017000v2 [Setaria italica]|uniref:Uncharacterized protein n=1 Tax=Setaria italica TaxID=4555 RepID=A0A368S370_SETIT|nr:hypothetical protein SETIT_8G017000v2 [Setaria italica]